MVEKTNHSTHKPFWACPGFPHCNGNLSIHRPGPAPAQAGEGRHEDADVETITRRVMQLIREERGTPVPLGAPE
eukprot:6830366-Heterocapsa_arctica.AAC.1